MPSIVESEVAAEPIIWFIASAGYEPDADGHGNATAGYEPDADGYGNAADDAADADDTFCIATVTTHHQISNDFYIMLFQNQDIRAIQTYCIFNLDKYTWSLIFC